MHSSGLWISCVYSYSRFRSLWLCCVWILSEYWEVGQELEMWDIALVCVVGGGGGGFAASAAETGTRLSFRGISRFWNWFVMLLSGLKSACPKREVTVLFLEWSWFVCYQSRKGIVKERSASYTAVLTCSIFTVRADLFQGAQGSSRVDVA